jgi:predicted nucleotidyltransferase
LIEEIEHFLKRTGVPAAILYGSRARDDAIRTSDVDLILISSRFEGTPPHRRLRELHAEWDPALPFLEALAYTPDEFEQARKQLGIERIAHEEGIRIRADDEENG